MGWGPSPETKRRLLLLTIVAVVAAGWAIALGARGVPAVDLASAASAKHRAPAAACPFPSSLRPAFVSAARDTKLPRSLLYAVAKVESNLRQDARSAAGARGLLQVMPATAESLALNVDEPATNVLAGARYLREMLDRFGSADLALAAYNAGPTAVAAAGGAPSGDVLQYVANVKLLWHSASGCR
jgi:soluble lytic murein transglycosylase-like protein